MIPSFYDLSNAFANNAFSVKLSLADKDAAIYYGIYEGMSVPEDIRNLISKSVCQRGKPEDFLASNLRWYLVSPFVRSAAQSAGLTGVDFVDIGLGAAHECLEGYTLMRPESCLNLVHDDRSDIVWAHVNGRRMVERWYQLFLDRNKLEAAGNLPDFVAIAEFPFFGVVSQKFADILAVGRFSGYSIKRLPILP